LQRPLEGAELRNVPLADPQLPFSAVLQLPETLHPEGEQDAVAVPEVGRLESETETEEL
jgi:hypothetical protein